MQVLEIRAEPLTQANFADYGQVVEVPEDSVQSMSANQGTASRYNYLAHLQNEHPVASKSKPNLCIFSVNPIETTSKFSAKLLERHVYSSQLFIPMHSKSFDPSYLVIVCMSKENDKNKSPDLSSLRAFICGPRQAVNYKAGCWHHPMIALKNKTDFMCLVWESGTEDDCEELYFDQIGSQVSVILG